MRLPYLLALVAIGGCFLMDETGWDTNVSAVSPASIDSTCTRHALNTTWQRESIYTTSAFDGAGQIKGVDFWNGTVIRFRWVPDSGGKWLLDAIARGNGRTPAPDSIARLDAMLRTTMAAILTACGDPATPVTTLTRRK